MWELWRFGRLVKKGHVWRVANLLGEYRYDAGNSRQLIKASMGDHEGADSPPG